MTHTSICIRIGVCISFFAMFILIVVVVVSAWMMGIRNMTKHTGTSLGILAFL